LESKGFCFKAIPSFDIDIIERNVYNDAIKKRRKKMPEDRNENGVHMGCPEPGRDCKGCTFPCEADS